MVRLFAALMLLSGLVAQGQSIKNYSLSPAGSFVNKGSYKILWQIGGITRGASANNNTTVFQDFFSANQVVAITGIYAEGNNRIIYYPNPVSDYLNIQNKEQQIRHYELVDAKGIIIENVPINRFDGKDIIEIKDLPNGLYLLTIKGESGYKSVQIKILKR